MLKSHYQYVVIGKSYISLIFAIIKSYKSDVLVLDEPSVSLGSKWYLNIGNLEKILLEEIGQKYQINALCELDSYLESVNTFISLNNKFIEFGSSPLANIRELARKIPEMFTEKFIEALSNLEAETFDREFFTCFEDISKRSMNVSKVSESLFNLKSQDQLDTIFSNFQKSISTSDNIMTEQLHFVLQVLFQTVFSNSKNSLETSYLLSALLSPRYKVNEKKLIEDLTFRFRSLGGDFKCSNVQDFEIYQDKLNFILLDSFEGVIKSDDLYLFGKIPSKFPFEVKTKKNLYNAIDLQVPVYHGLLEHYKNKRLVFSLTERLGTNSPHWEVFFDNNNMMSSTYVYADFEGSRPSFHYKKAARDVFKSIETLLPGIDFSDWMSEVKFKESKDVWVEYLGQKNNPGNFISKNDANLVNKESGKKILKTHYWGPVRARSMGMFTYMIDLKIREFE